ncbi:MULTISPECIES: hypothetical protein [Xenorhabdus]|uniref:hypothetical protein n=1 Tax=Xenorhabdus TaxID=626 RepID=UPI000647B304|nr:MULTISPECIES: hypothetical protein [Xenorhabdus]MBC8944498.1 hypothetical protein [Xenorhabdus indica]
MDKYIVVYNGVDSNNDTSVSTQIALDIDMSKTSAADFLGLLENNALTHATELDSSVARVAIVGIYQL